MFHSYVSSHGSLADILKINAFIILVLGTRLVIPVIIEDAGLLAAFIHPNRIDSYAHGASFSCRLPAPSMIWVYAKKCSKNHRHLDYTSSGGKQIYPVGGNKGDMALDKLCTASPLAVEDNWR
jgi:hypothetical protein